MKIIFRRYQHWNLKMMAPCITLLRDIKKNFLISAQWSKLDISFNDRSEIQFLNVIYLVIMAISNANIFHTVKTSITIFTLTVLKNGVKL